MRGVALRRVFGVLAGHNPPGVLEKAHLRETQIQGEEKADAEQQEREIDGAAEQAVEEADDVFECCHMLISLLHPIRTKR